MLDDQPHWRWRKDGDFFVKSTYNRFVDSGVVLTDTLWIWKNICPPKVRVYLWLVIKNTLLTWSALQKRG